MKRLYRYGIALAFVGSICLMMLPGCENPLNGEGTGTGGGQVAAPQFSPAEGIYQDTQIVSITTSTPGAMIKYTTDGSAPSPINGVVYEQAIAVPITTTIRAAAFKEQMDASDVSDSVYTIDSFPAGTSVSPATEALISANEAITISFDETMNPATLVIGGQMGVEAAAGVWDSVSLSNDTLHLNPSGSWDIGGFRTLTVDCSDLAGNPISQISLDYDVCVIYVRAADGDDGAAGTRDTPLRSVAAGILKADTLFSAAQVKVAEGSYDIDSASGGTIILQEGISVLGGYSAADWSDRDPDTYISSITDTNNTVNGTAGNPLAAMRAGNGLTRNTVFSGFTVRAAARSYAAAFLNDGGSPTYENNEILYVSAHSYQYGFYNMNSSPLIQTSRFAAGNGISHCCIYEKACSSQIVNNEIRVSTDLSQISYGILQDNGSQSIIRNNTFLCSLFATRGIGLHGGSSPIIENNIFASEFPAAHAVYEEDTASDPQTLRNNNFFELTFYYDADGLSTYSTIADMETDLTAESITTGGNTAGDPVFAAEYSDLHLTAGSHKNVLQGGIDGAISGEGWGFAEDLEGATRTSNTSLNPDNANAGGWSMGCYEED